jgi:hypothetical protein
MTTLTEAERGFLCLAIYYIRIDGNTCRDLRRAGITTVSEFDHMKDSVLEKLEPAAT